MTLSKIAAALIIGTLAEMEGTSEAMAKAHRLNRKDGLYDDEEETANYYRKQIAEHKAEQLAKREAIAAPIREERLRRKAEAFAKRNKTAAAADATLAQMTPAFPNTCNSIKPEYVINARTVTSEEFIDDEHNKVAVKP
jgi:sRNA-binding protein